MLPPGSLVVVNCSSLYFWKAGESSFWTASSPRIDLIALVTSASYGVVSRCTGGRVALFWWGKYLARRRTVDEGGESCCA